MSNALIKKELSQRRANHDTNISYYKSLFPNFFANRSMSRRAFRRNHPSGGGAISSGAVPTVAEAMEFEAMDTSAPFPPPQL